MPLTPNFVTSQIIGNPQGIVFQDTSTGSDGAITKRRIILTQADGLTLVPNGVTTTYIDWALVDNPVTIQVLPQDYALNVTVQWLSSSNVVLYTKTLLQLYQLYENSFYYNQIQLQASTPNIINDSNYWTNMGVLMSYIDNGVQAVAIGGDIAAAQNACDKGMYMVNNANKFFS